MATAPVETLQRLGQSWSLEEPVAKRKMLVIVNPYASTVSDHLKSLVIHALESRYDVTAFDTQRKGHGTELVREAVQEGYEVVVAFGGDGTLNEAANGLVGTDVPLFHLPGGATNVFCKMHGVPGEIVDATEHLLRIADDWHPRKVDLGRVNGRYFTFSSGYGLDASVVKTVDQRPELKSRHGAWFFVYAAVTTFLRRYLVRPPLVEVQLPGRTLRGITAVVQNGDPFTYFNARPIHLAEGVTTDSGDLGGAVLHRASPIDVPTVAWRLLSKRARALDHKQISAIPNARVVRARSVDGRPVPLEMDGDWIGDVTDAEFAVVPRALTIVT